MEDATTYTYKYEKENDKPERSLKVYFAVIIVVFFIAAVVAGIVTGKIKAKKEAETTTAPVTEAPATEVTEPAVDDTYQPGTYSVNTGDVALRFRAEHNKDAEAILEIADKTKLDITEIFVDENATDEVFRYWGKTKYLGHTGWITMKYLKRIFRRYSHARQDDRRNCGNDRADINGSRDCRRNHDRRYSKHDKCAEIHCR